MIKRRKRKGTANTEEFFVENLNKWMSLTEIVKHESCIMGKDTIRRRIESRRYTDMDTVIFDKKDTRFRNETKHNPVQLDTEIGDLFPAKIN